MTTKEQILTNKINRSYNNRDFIVKTLRCKKLSDSDRDYYTSRLNCICNEELPQLKHSLIDEAERTH
jgi:hypothetical protein